MPCRLYHQHVPSGGTRHGRHKVLKTAASKGLVFRRGRTTGVARCKFLSDGRNGSSAGRPLSKIVVSLKTQSLGEAQDRRWPLVKQWRETFQRAQTGEPLSLAEIDAQAREIFTSTLERMEAADAKRRQSSVNEQARKPQRGPVQFP